jgi:hypothetical protein
LLWPDPSQRDRLLEIQGNLIARIGEAEREDWLGEVEGLKVSLAAAETNSPNSTNTPPVPPSTSESPNPQPIPDRPANQNKYSSAKFRECETPHSTWTASTEPPTSPKPAASPHSPATAASTSSTPNPQLRGLLINNAGALASTTTGTTGILAILELADAGDLHRYLAERIGELPGVHRVQTAIVARWIKRAGSLVIPRA